MDEVAETGSTNADLLELASAGAPDRSVLRTAHQTAGRGRLDRSWDAPPGTNLLVSLLFRAVPAVPSELTWRVGLAAAAACEAVAGADPVLKWPNDLLLGGRKLAGILAQSGVDHRPGHTDARFVVVGIGLNVGWAPPRAASLGEDIDPREVLSALLCAYDALPVDIVECYRARLDTIGRAVRIELPDGTTVEGRATDVQADGRLVVLDDCGVTHRYDTGDIVHLR